MTTRPALATLAGLLSLAALGACTNSSEEDGGSLAGSANVAPRGGGEAVYQSRVEGGNTFTCATCHALSEPASDGLRRPGHPIGDATRRPHYKNGKLTRMLDAVNSCLTEWMNADPWTEADERYKALYAFLDARAGTTQAPPVEIQRVDPPASLDGGDAERGLATFNGSCAVCHGKDAVGTERAPKIRGLGLDARYAATRVRASGRTDSKVHPGLRGGIMPFWGADRLSDAELVDITAFLASAGEVVSGGGGGTTDTTTRSCGKTHARVGDVAVLAGKFHGVSGTAHVVDDCTIELRDFAFDGNGIDVRVYGGTGGSYAKGFGMGDDLRKAGGYSGATVRVNLPIGRTLDDLDGVSIWCVPAGVDFGSGLFAEP